MGNELRTTARREFSEAHRAKLRKLVNEHGVAKVAAAANVGLNTIPRALAKLEMRPSTVTALVAFLEAQ